MKSVDVVAGDVFTKAKRGIIVGGKVMLFMISSVMG